MWSSTSTLSITTISWFNLDMAATEKSRGCFSHSSIINNYSVKNQFRHGCQEVTRTFFLFKSILYVAGGKRCQKIDEEGRVETSWGGMDYEIRILVVHWDRHANREAWSSGEITFPMLKIMPCWGTGMPHTPRTQTLIVSRFTVVVSLDLVMRAWARD